MAQSPSRLSALRPYMASIRTRPASKKETHMSPSGMEVGSMKLPTSCAEFAVASSNLRTSTISSTDSTSSAPSSPSTSITTSSAPHSIHQVRQVGMHEYVQAADCLARAFAKDEVARYMVDMSDSATELSGSLYALHFDMMKYLTAAHIMKGLVTTVGDDFNAVALWMPPGETMDDWWTVLRSGMWRLLFKLDREARVRWFKEFFPLLHETKDRVLGRGAEAWYLVYLGTKPGSERMGYGRALVEHGCSLADAAGLPAYLESSNAVNVPFYAKSGFRQVKEVYLQRAGKPVSLSIMVRDPKPLGGEKQPSLSKTSSSSSGDTGAVKKREKLVTPAAVAPAPET